MGFSKFSSDFLMESFTLVDNLFINEHLPYSDEKQIKVYLYGLYLCMSPQKENSLETMTQVLNMKVDEIITAYTYFEEAGLVQIISKKPFEIKYLSLKGSNQPPKKYKAEKWNDFNTHLQQMFPERMISPNEYNEFYEFLGSYKIKQDAMLMIVQYCINLKGNNVRYPYIIAVAKNWANEGVKTVGDVENKLNEYETQTEDMREVLTALRRKTGAELEEKQMLLKWKKSWGFELPAIIKAGKMLKGSRSFKSLEKKLDEFYRMSIFTPEAMADYQKHREKLTQLAININKTLGVYYESLDHIIETYTTPWTRKGFDDDALLTLAHHCFVTNIRTLDGMNKLIDKFYKKGLLSVKSINEYIQAQLNLDKKIKKVIEKSGRSRNVTNNDREFYRTWTVTWGFTEELILYASSQAVGKTYPIPFINKVLSNWKENGVKSVEEAKKVIIPVESKKASQPSNFTERQYTKEELQTIIRDFDDIKYSDL